MGVYLRKRYYSFCGRHKGNLVTEEIRANYLAFWNCTKVWRLPYISEVNNENAANRKVALSVRNDGNAINVTAVEFELINTESGQEIKLPAISISCHQ